MKKLSGHVHHGRLWYFPEFNNLRKIQQILMDVRQMIPPE